MAITRLLKPETGKVLISGQNIETIDLKELRSSICVIPQEPFIFKGTLRNNIDPFNQFKEFDIIEALKKTFVNGFNQFF